MQFSSQPPIQLVPDSLSLGLNWPGCQTDHSPTTTAKVKYEYNYTSTPPYAITVRTGTILPLPLNSNRYQYRKVTTVVLPETSYS